MKKIFNILLLIMTLASMIALSVYLVYDYFHDNLKDLNLTISRNTDNGFIDYEETHDMIMNICDTLNNYQINMIPVDSVVDRLRANPWITNVNASVSLKAYLEVEVEECEPIFRIYNSKGKSIYLDENGYVFPTNNDYVPHILVGSGNVNFSTETLGNVSDEEYAKTDLPKMFLLMKKIQSDDYARNCVKHVFIDKNENYILSLNNTNVIVNLGDDNNIEEKLSNMKHFFEKMQGNPELDNYKEINLNYKNQVVCTKNK